MTVGGVPGVAGLGAGFGASDEGEEAARITSAKHRMLGSNACWLAVVLDSIVIRVTRVLSNISVTVNICRTRSLSASFWLWIDTSECFNRSAQPVLGGRQ